MHDIVHSDHLLATRPTPLILSAFFLHHIIIILSKCAILIILGVNPNILRKLVYQLLALLLGHKLPNSAGRHWLATQTVRTVARKTRPTHFRRDRNEIDWWNLINRLKLASTFSFCTFKAVGYHCALFKTHARLLLQQNGLRPWRRKHVFLDLHLVAHKRFLNRTLDFK